MNYIEYDKNRKRKSSIKIQTSPVEFFDLVQFFLKDYNDHQLRCVIYLKNELNIEYIKKAVLLSMDVFPILKSRFISGKNPHYEYIDSLGDDIVTYVQSDFIEQELNKFITTKIDELKGPQIMVRVIRNKSKDIVSVVINHMIGDASGFEEYLYLLSSIYTNLKKDSDYRPVCIDTSRSLTQIYKKFNIIDRLKMIFMPYFMSNNKNTNDDKLIFPFSNENDTIPFIVTYRLESNRFLKLKEYSKMHNVTINDTVLAGFIRALCNILNVKDRVVSVPCPIDLRKYIPGGKIEGLCNFSPAVICNIGPDIGKNFDETVLKVKSEMDKKKSLFPFPGLNMIVKIDIIFKLLPYILLKKLFKRVFRNTTITMTNMGIIDKNKLMFDDAEIKDAFITSSIRYKCPPSFQMAVSTFNDCMTFSISLYGSESDKSKINEFFNTFNNEIPV